MTRVGVTDDGKPEALKLAFACFIADVTMSRFEGLSAENQVAFAQNEAGLDALGLIKAFRYLGAYLNAQHQSAPATPAPNPQGHVKH